MHQPPYPGHVKYIWNFKHSYRYEMEEIVKFCQGILGFTPHVLLFTSRSNYDSNGTKTYNGYESTTFTLRTEEDAFAIKLVFAEYERTL